jgi:hypothetical protein
MPHRLGRFLALALVAGLAAACTRTPGDERPAADTATTAAAPAVAGPVARPAPDGLSYPAPRFPSYLKPPKSVEDMLPAVRVLVRNKSGFLGKGLGILEPGETVLLVPTVESEDLVVDTIKRALEERKVKVDIQPDYALVGLTKEKALEFVKLRHTYTAEKGYMEASGWVDAQFPEPAKAKAWLREQRPDLAEALFPQNREMSPEMRDIFDRLSMNGVGQGIQKYLGAHPAIRGAYWNKGGGTGLRRALHPMENKFLGTFMYDNRWTVMSAMTSYPGDLWQLAEEQELEPLIYVDRIEAVDPEGTNVWADVTEEMAQRWAQGSYQRGHLYMFPNQASGRFGYSFVDYPAFQQRWIPREPMCMLNGVIAGTNGHGGFFPRWEVEFKDGRIVDVRGGGLYGETLKTFLKYPHINEVTYPFHKHPGFWYLYEIAFGTHPKAFRDPAELANGSAGPERQRSGVIHWGLGLRLWHDPDGPVESKSWLDFTGKYNLPRDHNFHTHTYFTTYRVHLRNADKWLKLLDRGHMTSLDNPEVRALASRYGNPDLLLAEDWIPDVPGINAPGAYADYAANPWPFVMKVLDKAQAGTYEHYYPPAKPAATSKSTN